MSERHVRVTGRVVTEASDRGIAGVGVSDGLTVTMTDATGRFELAVDPRRRHTTLIAVTVPAGWRAPLGPFGAPDFYRRVDVSAGPSAEAADFVLRKDPASAQDGYRFVALADVHVAASGLNPTEVFGKQLEEIERLSQEGRGEIGLPAFIAVAGDLTNDATAGEFADYVAGTATSSIPVWSAPGNHDLAGRIHTGAYPKLWPDVPYRDTIDAYRRAVGPEWYSFQYGRHHFVVLENYRGLGQPDQLAWLERDLAQNAKGKHVVVVSHVPWNVPQTPESHEAAPYLAMLADYDVELLLAGHTHANDVSAAIVGRARQIVTTTLGAATLDSTPRGFRFVDVEDDRIVAPYWELEARRDPTIVFPVGPVPWAPDAVRVNRYTPPGVQAEAEYQLGQRQWRPMTLRGRRAWTADLDGPVSAGEQRLTVRVRDHAQSPWLEKSVGFEVAAGQAAPATAGSPWLMFRGDARRTGVSPDDVAPPLHLAWVSYTGGTILGSSPAVAHGHAYIGIRDEDDVVANGVLALDVTNGQRVWFAAASGAVEASVAVSDDLVLAPSVRGPLKALDARTGRVRWFWEPAGSPCWMYFSPLVADSVIYQAYSVRDGTWVAGLDAASGAPRWQTQEPVGRNWMSRGAPAMSGDRLYFATAYANLVSVERATAQVQWQRALGAGLAVRSVPVAAGALVLLACQGDQVVAVEADSGAEQWRYRSDGGSLLPGVGTAASPAVADGVAYAGFTDGRVVAINVETGSELWHYVANGPVLSSPIVSGDVLYVGCNDGTLRAIARDTGTCVWSYDLGSPILSTPVATGNAVIVGAWDGNVYAFARD